MTTATWDPGQYLRYGDERGRPFVDLVSRITSEACTVVDLGCGPGQLTPVLRARWPQARITGLDSSPEMIARAEEQNTDPLTEYAVADAADWSPEGPVDVLVSNAMLQWVPGHADLLLPWTEHIAPGGALAFQVPGNFAAPSHRLLWETAARPAYSRFTQDLGPRAAVLDPADYLALLSRPGWTVDAWETTYLHVLPGEDPVFEWISGTGARPVLQALPDEVRGEFEAEYKAALREAYPRQDVGTVLPFRRIFVVAHRTNL
ncbi:trans-aconitate 2-methyltransferase [Ornithinimicrobium sp. F0845]|uniref:trans-aconitate 2-methyltransferase n=1 Tax=Ornithinimicrobium sp. F0845 TaxID=2926412 RepID=UPI001FF38933|nr:trans-aconitate 2-methyltransferase [Ornithinimicrobium sp. F0845]MCK0111841.1 trans-aconitate 2-methyltransferase [Ornithinimicrobium sp. F0845]